MVVLGIQHYQKDSEKIQFVSFFLNNKIILEKNIKNGNEKKNCISVKDFN